ncbi:MAG: Asp-tRNA(Asn)/Glu-tRNA(Gln) amidotransferase subunit GatA [Oligoflexia bacterium]|nr:Asp-tRNA(Asn)/Glu-tRNA(Gln) amidotransferase subunit GatA [Oligoflexia bacterium]
MSDITLLTASEMVSQMRAGQLSCKELCQAFLNKLEKQKGLNSFLTIAPEKVLARAEEAQAKIKAGSKEALLGIPVAVKDMILTKDLKTTCASKILENFIPPYTATCVNNLESRGAVVLGKTNMDEFAMGSSNENSAFGSVKNPWNPECVPGGSSGGSAVAVAARLAPLALGTDTGGSVRQPASFCGIAGMKPTYGRVSRYGVVAFASSLDQVGGFATNVRDLALLMSAVSGHDPMDSTSVKVDVPDFSALLGQDIKGLRLGMPKEYFIEGLSSEVKACIEAALKQLEKLGAKLVEVSLPNTELAVATYYILAPAEASSNLARYDGIRYGHRAKGTHELEELYEVSRSEGFGEEVKRRIMIGTYVLSSGYFDAYYLRAQKVRTLIANDFRTAFAKHCDLIVCPTAPTTAFKIGEKSSDPLAMYLNDIFTIPVNLAGLPGMSIPCGFDQKGLPVGLQLIGKPWDEAGLLKTAYAYESETDWHKRLPKIH